MTWVIDGPRTAWLFTREGKSVRFEIHRYDNRLHLVIAGPGTARKTLEFPDLATLLAHQAAQEQRLTAEGYVLEEFTSERRRWPR